MKQEKHILFDWAIKRLLRDKANFVILEGLLTTLLNEPIVITELLESESNRSEEESKQNRLDLLAKNSKNELIIIEVQLKGSVEYLKRMLFATSKLVTEYLKKGEQYSNIRKIYSINLVYFSMGKGEDVIYHGKTEFRGLFKKDLLDLSRYQKNKLEVDEAHELFPEYYILRVKDFDKKATTPLEEWMHYLKSGEVAKETQTPGLIEIRDRFNCNIFSSKEYDAYLEQMWEKRYQDDAATWEMEEAVGNAMLDGIDIGLERGLEKGLEKGLEEGREMGARDQALQSARIMLTEALSINTVAKYTGLNDDELKQLLSELE